MTDARIRWMLYRYHNRAHDGEIWLAFNTPRGLLLLEQSGRWPDNSMILGEVQTRIINDDFVDDILSLQERPDEELQQMRQQTEEHKARRARMYKRVPMEQRFKYLRGENQLKMDV